ncbi:MAG: 1-aminocyclopropane-1-carboxylate deaminase/D-cysteine desulfhydrase [Methylococcales bacterium]|nr:MAG: 1-aminocyclopropane-1-carboxylate deaminase/D-cysteine desulfhydrase [Methylococcales bacterium]
MHPKLIKLEENFKPSILTKIDEPLCTQFNIELWMKRDDQLHPVISGNKWRKLKFILNHALYTGSDTIISMGGVYSNHLHALAYTCKAIGLKNIAYIRGDAPTLLTPTLADLTAWGTELRYISRTEYRQLRQYKSYLDLPGLKPQQYWLPEGGAQPLALSGLAELVEEIEISYDYLCVPCGTGTTLAGLISATPDHISLLGFAALKNASFLNTDVSALLAQNKSNWQINLDYHFGGFASSTPELLSFIKAFETKTNIQLEPVYTGKMMYALYDLISKGHFNAGQRIIALHTGGLQGDRQRRL